MPSLDPLNVPVGGNGLLSFNVGTLADPTGNSAIALTDLTQPGVAASIGAGGGFWTLDTYTQSIVGIPTGAYDLDLQIGAGADLSTYNFTWYLAGGNFASTIGGAVGTFGTFTVNVNPEPATVVLLGFGLTGMAIVARQRRRHRKHRQKE